MQEEKRMTEDEMVGWHHSLSEFSKLWDLVTDREACMLQSMGLHRVGHNSVTELN